MEGDSLRVAVESTLRRMSAPQAGVEHRRGGQRQRHHSRLKPLRLTHHRAPVAPATNERSLTYGER